MDKTIFYTPNILENYELPHDEAVHCIKVLRKKEGDEILLTDGKGYFYDAKIIQANYKHCKIEIIESIQQPKGWDFNLEIAFAPTKNIDRIEWFVEKATEIGIDSFFPIICEHSERKEIKIDRLNKIAISAMKQSEKATLPHISEVYKFEDIINKKFEGRKFIAHCQSQQKELLKESYKANEDVLILIGPEGDFSEKEIKKAMSHNFEPISLGKSRLRTETAALVASNMIQILNQ